MGFFSYLCVGCRKPLLSGAVTTPNVNEWMSHVVVLKGSDVFHGAYDGYGRVGNESGQRTLIMDERTGNATEQLYHADCYAMVGSPKKQTKKSKNAPDQGYFFKPGKYDFASPLGAKAGKTSKTAHYTSQLIALRTYVRPAPLRCTDNDILNGMIIPMVGRPTTTAKARDNEYAVLFNIAQSFYPLSIIG